MAIDDRTLNLNLPLPNAANTLEEDAARLRSAFTTLDAEVHNKQAALGFTPEDAAKKGQPDGYASLDATGKVPSAQLPGFVDDVLEYANLSSFPGVGESGKMYVALDTGRTYRWSGSAYVEISPSPGSTDDVVEGAVNLYFTPQRARDAQQPATALALGVVKVGSGLTVGGDGTLSVAGGGGGGTGLPAFAEQIIVPTANGQTAFVPAGGYIAGQIELYVNGVLLYGNGDDYTAADGVNISLTQGVNTTDTLLLRKWFYLPEANAVNKNGDSMTGALNEAAGVSLASGATTDIGTANSNTINVTGTTGITSLGTAAAGVKRRLVFAGSLTLTHNAASLILPGGFNITTSAGDVLEFLSLGSGNWRCIGYVPVGGVVSLGVAQTFTKAQRGAVVPLADGATITPDFSAANMFRVQLGGNRALGVPTNMAEGQSGSIDIYQDSTGSRTLSYGWCWQWPGASAPTLTTTARAKDKLAYQVDVYKQADVTISIATPGVVTWNNHGLMAGQQVRLTTTGALPTGLAANTTYFVIPVDANTFQLSATQSGSAIATSGSQSGTHTMTAAAITGSLLKGVA